MFVILYIHSETKNQKEWKNKESPPPTSNKMAEDDKLYQITPEIPMNLNTNINGTIEKSLEEENFELKEQRICKVIN